MQATNRSALKAIIITLIGIVVLVGLYQAIRVLLLDTDNETPSVASQESTTPPQEPLADTDSDGLPDVFESYYNTDPQQADSDNDGTPDLAELDAGRDPTTPGPDDVSKPPTGEAITDPQTLTQLYLATLPNDVPRSEVLSQDRLQAFVDLNSGELLPEIPLSEITTNQDSGKNAVGAYLESISATHNSKLVAISNDDIEAALIGQLQLNPTAMQQLVTDLEHNYDTLKNVSVPTEVLDLHQTLLAASRSLATNVKAIKDINDDFVGGLVAAQNIDSLGAVFQDIAQQVVQLEQQYGLQ